MKNTLILFFLSIFSVGFSQQKIQKQVLLTTNVIEISTLGLDTITLLNADDDQVTVSLFNENANSEDLVISETAKVLKIEFKTPFIPKKDGVFRKFITKRLNRSYAVVKIPKNKTITLYGRNINIDAKSYQGNLTIFIDKGDLKFHTIQGNVNVHLFQGTIVASISKANINIKTTKGTIVLNTVLQTSPFVKSVKNSSKKLVVNSINANVILTEVNN